MSMTTTADAASSRFPPLGPAVTRSDRTVEVLRSAIVSGRLKPGQLLVERKLAEELGVSKTPVREALIALGRSGLVELGGRSFSVRELTPQDVRHVYEERVLLEPWAIANAARGGSDYADAERALADARGGAAIGDHAARALANRRFHRAMYSGCENSFIVAALDGLQDLTALAVAGVLWESWPTSGREAVEHQEILDSARAGDGEKAGDLMRQHISASIVRLTTNG
jgi:DNA-binding GntR family transcriptional regulator